ncbi:hypothetical protein [Methylomicrobium lacus]|uniref:hypothetical protein n=1 Tax=Methylomicrobium lacus TaxID=136992 RepID=UPI0035A83EBE
MQFGQGFLGIDAELPQPIFLAGNVEPADPIAGVPRQLLVILPVANAFRAGAVVIDRDFVLLHHRFLPAACRVRNRTYLFCGGDGKYYLPPPHLYRGD